jgi:uncharacterized membrane protein HdeD (DUF308 family)
MSTAAATPGFSDREEKVRVMSASLARNWWAVLLRGLAAILFGAIALLLPGVTIAALVLVFAAYMLADGVLTIVSAVKAARRQERWGLLVLEGVADLAAGVLALLVPTAALLVFVALAVAWAVVSGALLFTAAFRLRRDHGRIWQIVGGVASIAWGVLLALFPAPGLVVLTWWLGAYALIFGGALIALAFSLRRRQGGRPAGAPQPA